MDNASVHSAATTQLRDRLAYTEVRFFPKNSTSKTQPLDAGIIQQATKEASKQENTYGEDVVLKTKEKDLEMQAPPVASSAAVANVIEQIMVYGMARRGMARGGMSRAEQL